MQKDAANIHMKSSYFQLVSNVLGLENVIISFHSIQRQLFSSFEVFFRIKKTP